MRRVLFSFSFGVLVGVLLFSGFVRPRVASSTVLGAESEETVVSPTTIVESEAISETHSITPEASEISESQNSVEDANNETTILAQVISITDTPSVTPIDSPTPTATITPTVVPSSTPTATPTQSVTPQPQADRPLVETTPTPKQLSTTSNLETIFDAYANQYHIDGQLLRRIANCESHFNNNAIGYHGEYVGMFQFGVGSWRSIRKQMGLDANPDLRFGAEESIKTAAYAISLGRASMWPSCSK